VECSGQLEPLVKDRNYQVGAHRNPDLSLHGVGTRAVVVLDAQMPFDPAEEQFNSPSQLVKHGHGQCGYFQIVGKEDEFLAVFQVEESHSSQQHWVSCSGLLDCRLAVMVASQSGEAIYWLRTMALELKIGLGTCDEERASIGNHGQAGEVHVSTVHKIERTSLEIKMVESSHVVLACSSDVNASGDWASQVDLGVHLDACLGLTKVRPRKKRQRQIDRGGIQGINRVVEFDTEVLPCE
jgi:hypothetical protein